MREWNNNKYMIAWWKRFKSIRIIYRNNRRSTTTICNGNNYHYCIIIIRMIMGIVFIMIVNGDWVGRAKHAISLFSRATFKRALHTKFNDNRVRVSIDGPRVHKLEWVVAAKSGHARGAWAKLKQRQRPALSLLVHSIYPIRIHSLGLLPCSIILLFFPTKTRQYSKYKY